jgi:hypothetical protein
MKETRQVQTSSRWRILIADRGWVYVGRPVRDGDQIIVSDAFNIRRWGTVTGLGQLALNGPSSETVLDFYGVVRLHVLSIAGGEVECYDKIWDEWFSRRKK